MKIQSVSIYNVRSIQKLEDLDLSNGFDIIIGQNDSGKSTILYALDNFFNIKDGNFSFENGDQKINDLCHDSIDHDLGGFIIKKSEIGILCCFAVEEEEGFSKRSNLLEFANNGVLKVLKKVSKDKIYNKKQYQYYILGEICVDEDFQRINDGAEKDLIELMERYPDSKNFLENINDKGKPENVERKKALLRYAKKNLDVVPSFDEFNFVKDDDEIWPEFDLIESHGSIDSSNKIIDSIFSEISKELIEKYRKEDSGFKALLKNLEDKFGFIANKICKHAQDSYIRNLESIKVEPKILLKPDRDFKIKTNGQTEYSHFDCQGDGTKRRLMVSILQCGKLLKKEKAANKQDDDEIYEKLRIWAFDEPELHLHPGAQRELFSSFKIFKEKGFQILCSTHSTVFVDNLNMKACHLLDLDSDLHTEEIKKDIGIENEIKLLLGVKSSDIFYSNGFIVVEGETEQSALPILYEGIFKETLDSVGIKIICSKGCDNSYEKISFFFK